MFDLTRARRNWRRILAAVDAVWAPCLALDLKLDSTGLVPDSARDTPILVLVYAIPGGTSSQS